MSEKTIIQHLTNTTTFWMCPIVIYLLAVLVLDSMPMTPNPKQRSTIFARHANFARGIPFYVNVDSSQIPDEFNGLYEWKKTLILNEIFISPQK